MVRKEEFEYKSRDNKTMIHAQKWIPEEEPIAIFQIIHGMQEFIDRYDDYATFMAEHGLLVIGNDMLGHGGSVHEGDTFGYFCEDDPATVLVRDAHHLKKIVQKEYPNLPVIVLGHSFGSFILRDFLRRYGNGIDGAIIQGGGVQDLNKLKIAKVIGKTIQAVKGPKYRSKLINNLAFGHYLDRIPNPRTPSDWLSHNEANIDAYLANPMNNFMFTVNGFLTLGELVTRTQNPELLENIPKDLPILVTSGKEDPVGDYGVATEKMFHMLQDDHHLINMELKLYDGMRHELQNEPNHQVVYDDQLAWIMKVIQKQ